MVKKYRSLKLFIALLIFSAWAAIAFSQQHKIDSLRNILKAAKEDTNKVNTLNALCLQLNKLERFDSSIVLAEKAPILAEKLGFKKGLADALSNLGYIYIQQGDYSTAQEYALKALAIYQGIANKNGIAVNFSRLGILYGRQSNYSRALDYMLKALAVQEELGDKGNIAYTFANIGNVYLYLANYPEALKYDFKALSMCQEIGDERGSATTLCAIGDIYSSEKDYSKALEYMSKGEDISNKIGDKASSAYNLCNMGEIYAAQGNYSKALEYISNALALFQETGEKDGVVSCYTSIGGIYAAQGNIPAAIENEYKALAMAKKTGYERGIVACYRYLGSMNTSSKNYKQVKMFFDSALIISKAIGEKELISGVYSELSHSDSSMGDYKAALENYKKYFVYHDSIVNEANAKKMVKEEMNYEFEQKQAAEKAMQDKKDAIRDAEDAKHKAESKIQKILIGFSVSIAIMLILVVLLVLQRMKGVEKKKLIAEQQKSWLELKALRTQMNPHFLYNTINSIQSFILKNDTRASSNYLAQFAGLMRGVLENSRKDKITLEEEVEGLTNYLDFEIMRFPAKFDYRIKVDDTLDRAKVLLPPLLIQPYVENAIWHGLMHKKEGGGELMIMFENVDNHLKCIVDDNGIGRKAAGEMKKESVHKSVGLSIVAERVESMNKMYHWDMKIEITDKLNEDGTSAGTRVELLFPLILNNINYA